MGKIEEEVGAERFAAGRYREAADLFTRMSKSAEFEEFLTLPAYEMID
jgi:malate synthase